MCPLFTWQWRMHHNVSLDVKHLLYPVCHIKKELCVDLKPMKKLCNHLSREPHLKLWKTFSLIHSSFLTECEPTYPRLSLFLSSPPSLSLDGGITSLFLFISWNGEPIPLLLSDRNRVCSTATHPLWSPIGTYPTLSLSLSETEDTHVVLSCIGQMSDSGH